MQHHAAVICIIVQDLRFFMEDATNAVTAVLAHHGETFRFHKLLDCRTYGTQANTRFNHFQRQIEALLRHFTQTLAKNSRLANDEHF